MRGTGPVTHDVGADYKDVARSQQMIEEFRCHKRDEMTASNAGNTRRFKGVAIEDQDAAFKAFPASTVGCLGFPVIAPSHGKNGRAVYKAAEHNTAPTNKVRLCERSEPQSEPLDFFVVFETLFH